MYFQGNKPLLKQWNLLPHNTWKTVMLSFNPTQTYLEVIELPESFFQVNLHQCLQIIQQKSGIMYLLYFKD